MKEETEEKIRPLIGLFVLCAFAILFFVFMKKCNDDINEERGVYESFLGKSVVFKQDTLLIIDYSLVNETLKLDNGTEVSVKLVKRLKEIE